MSSLTQGQQAGVEVMITIESYRIPIEKYGRSRIT